MRASVFKKKHQPVTIGRFEIVRLLGSGAMGMVYEAIDPRDDETVAIKVLRSKNPRALALFKKEFRALSRLSHPNLVTLYELGRAGQRYFFSMELVRGIPLQRYLWGLELPDTSDLSTLSREASESLSALSISPVTDFKRLRDVFGQLCTGVSALHQFGKLHRDIKPSNALVTSSGRVVLMDFGFVSEQGQGALESTHGHMVVGTPAFMSPEQARAAPPSPTSDWYSVGATLYMVVTGHPPFFGLNLADMMQAKQSRPPISPRALLGGIPEDIAELCMGLLEPDPRNRPDERAIFRVFLKGGERGPGMSLRAPTRGAAPPLVSAAAAPDARAGLVGRDAELAALQGAFARVTAPPASARPAAALVSSRAGLGKTTLLRHFCNQLRDDAAAVLLKARCYERDNTQYKALDGLVDALARHLKQLPDERARALIPAGIDALILLFPALLQVRLLAARETDAHQLVEDVGRRELRRRAFTAFRSILRRIGERAPVVVWVDDLQWGDVDSAELLATLLAPPAPPRALLIASHRSEDAEHSAALAPLLALAREVDTAPSVLQLELAPLAEDACLAIAERLLAVRAPEASADTAQAIARESQGSPLYVHELVRFVEREVAVAQSEGRRPRVSLEALLHVRIAQLGGRMRRLLAIVAVAGRPIKLRDALAAAGIHEDARSILRHLDSEHLVRVTASDDDTILETWHERVRATAVAQLDGVTLRAYHERLAEIYARAAPPDHTILAEHLRAAGQLARAREHIIAAARDAARARAHDQTADHYRLALELSGDDADATEALRTELAEALARSGRWTLAADAFVELARDQPAADPRLFARAAALMLAQGITNVGCAMLTTAMRETSLRPPGAARVLQWLRRGSTRLRGHEFQARDEASLPAIAVTRVDVLEVGALGLAATDLDAAEDLQARHLRRALDLGEPRRVARALALEAWTEARRGHAARGRVGELLRRARALIEGDGVNERSSRLRLQTIETLARSLLGELDTAIASAAPCEEALLAARPDDAWALTELRRARLDDLRRAGHFNKLRAERDRVAALARRVDSRELKAAVRLADAWLALASVSIDEGARWIEEARAHWTSRGACPPYADVLLTEAHLALARRDPDGAARLLNESWSQLSGTTLWKIQRLRVDALFTRALCHARRHAVDKSSQARRAAERDLAALQQEDYPGAAGLAALPRASLLASTNARAEAADALRGAVQTLDRAGLQLHARVAAHAHARLEDDADGERDRVLGLRSLGLRAPVELSEHFVPLSHVLGR